ncbi:HpcH/HpaI aldolase/citrate lyase family protein [Bosea sp. (in: a-proteobacteria)]|jgi:4-hydroxy-2-oxoheptanedioate aldolase|uniref:HpcH/HpaI aldolase family protein n=1 Tax=Bosea sp. (in: a-proteobacteria) TaxID=1871050 RepID=UPI0027325679|nr:aldolase/citrate lyase family protein [Bosea sp. (in: a-proteobacteria)]MDP3410009.1 aldolase/citrate lyase family protein [Bosea sp. (in: a-proteobacteria)]
MLPSTVLSSLADRLAKGDSIVSAWCGLPDPAIAGVLAREAFDAITLDMQHGPITLGDVIAAIPLINAAGKPALARIPVGEFQNVSKLFDSGVSGVIAPMINTMADARSFAAASKYPPMGERSWGSYGGLAASGLDQNGYLREANRFSLSFAMIETREAMAILDDILALEGIDAVFVGPSDLSIALSGGREVNALSAEVDEAIRHIIARASAVGKPVAIYAQSAERAKAFLDMGAKLVTVMSDTAFLRSAAQSALKILSR